MEPTTKKGKSTLTSKFYMPQLKDVQSASNLLQEVITATPLEKSQRHSEIIGANVFLKREDLQLVRSFKIRGAYNKMASLSDQEKEKGIVCASAGNHSQGVAYSCNKLKIKGTIYMPTTTSKQKIERVLMLGQEYIEIVLQGDSFDEANELALKNFKQVNKIYVHPFDDEKVIEGQATVALELLEQSNTHIDYVLVAIGGGGLAAGICSVFHHFSPKTKIIGIEPAGAASMQNSIRHGKNIALAKVDKFVDGASVKQVGQKTFPICQAYLSEVVTVPEGKICQEILDLYNKDGIIAEPAGALSIAALDLLKDKLKGKTVVCVLSGGNNDITRTAEIKERALLYANLKHYFLVNFPQRAGALKEFLLEVLGPDDDIIHFEYVKKAERETGPAVVGIVLKSADDLDSLMHRIKSHNFNTKYLNDKKDLLSMLI